MDSCVYCPNDTVDLYFFIKKNVTKSTIGHYTVRFVLINRKVTEF